MAIELNETKKRNTAYRFRIGDIQKGNPILVEGRFVHLEIGDKNVVRINIIANIVERYISDGEKKYATATIDDASGQIKLKTFGEDIEIIKELSEGDSVQVIGLIRDYNGEIYILPEIVKKIGHEWLLVRKLESQILRKDLVLDSNVPLREVILSKIRDAEKEDGIEIDKLIMDIDSPPNIINEEIKKLLEDGMIYEPRPGKVRYIG